MLVSYNWLKELVPALTASPEDVGAKLTAIGLELEETTRVGDGLEAVRIAAVRAVAPHPNRDRLSLVTVELESGRTQTVVCGASNVPPPGGLVVLAPLGTHLPAVNLTLEPRQIGGVSSEGMLCSEAELGLASDSAGIITFEAGRFTPGTRFYDAFPTSRDVVFSIGVTPNRPDALGHLGVARDVAAAYRIPFEPPVLRPSAKDGSERVEAYVSVVNQAPDRCPRYGAAVVDQVTVGPSPEWIRWRLHALGIRPISNVVDITNWVLLEYGNPMHAFDLTRVGERRIVVRSAQDGETLTTLDGVARELTSDDLVIADGERALALAGIMGGEDSEIRSETTAVLLECAYFVPSGVRRTSRRLSLSSDSSFRFERGVNWQWLPDVLSRAAQLLVDLAGGRAIAGQIFADGPPQERPKVQLRHSRVERLLGARVDFPNAIEDLQRLGFELIHAGPEEAEFLVPAWRPDVTLEADLIEEVARTMGLDHIEPALPPVLPREPLRSNQLEQQLRQASAALGLDEAVCYSFVSPQDLAALGAPAPVVHLSNPLSEERSVMTTHLLIGLLESLRHARRHGENDVRLFTLASVFREHTDGSHDEGLPQERRHWVALLAGSRESYLSRPAPLDVFDAKGLMLELIERCTGHHANVSLCAQQVPYLHPRGAASVFIDGHEVGQFGPLHPDVVDRFDLGGGAHVLELDLDALLALGRRVPRYRPIPRLPAVTRDIALDANDDLAAGSLLETIREAAGVLCESVELFDVYRSDQLGPERRSLAFRLTFRDPKASTDPERAKTLTDKQVDREMQRVVRAATDLGATLRA